MEKSDDNVTGVAAGFRCVQCGSPIETLYVQYSPGNIRLSKCCYCKSVADEYVECEMMILIIDLILHKPKAYRHIFFNMCTRRNVNVQSLLWKSLSAFIFLDLYRTWTLYAKEMKWPSSLSFTSFSFEFRKMLIRVVIGNIIFFYILLYSVWKFLSKPPEIYGWKQMMLAVLLSSYFKIFLVAMMIWESPSSMIFIIDIFVLSSNIVAIKVMTNSGMMKCIAVCGLAHVVNLLDHLIWCQNMSVGDSRDDTRMRTYVSLSYLNLF